MNERILVDIKYILKYDLDTLEQEVRSYISAGFELYGNIIMTPRPATKYEQYLFTYMQTLVKYK